MSWIEPITNHSARDQNTLADFLRQTGNIEHIGLVILPEMCYFADIVPLPDAGYPFADILNVVESNLEKIEHSGITIPNGWQPSKIWSASETSPDHNVINRWERNAEMLYNQVIHTKEIYRYAGEFYAGEDDYR